MIRRNKSAINNIFIHDNVTDVIYILFTDNFVIVLLVGILSPRMTHRSHILKDPFHADCSLF